MFSSIKKLIAVSAVAITATMFSGAAMANAPASGVPAAPQAQTQHQQVAHGRDFRNGPPRHFRRQHRGRYAYGHRRHRHGHRGYFRAPGYHNGFNLVLRFGDNDRRSGPGGGGGGRGGGGRGGGGRH